jgi:hypothetical protein
MQLSDEQLVSMSAQDRISAFAALGTLQLDERLQGKPILRRTSTVPVRLKFAMNTGPTRA